MTIGKKRIAAISAMLAATISFTSMASTNAAMEQARITNYEPITTDQLKTEAWIVLNNAKVAGRISDEDVKKFGDRLNTAGSVSDVEQTWSDVEATAQHVKDKHVSLDSLCTDFVRNLNNMQAKFWVPKEGYTFYRDRIAGILRAKKEICADEHFYSFWTFVILAIDLSSVQDRLTRALADQHPEVETLDELVLRTDNYLLRNELAARMLTTYKSFEVEPDNLQSSMSAFYNILKDKTFSRLQTQEVHDQLVRRLKDLHYESTKILPTEEQIDEAIVEVKRLADSGAINGHLNAFDDVRIQHELELIKKIKKAYPGPNPGIDPFNKELRMEEVRFMSLDLRFLQDWLGRMLRHDGESIEGREQVLRAMRRSDLAYFSHRLTRDDVLGIHGDIAYAIKHATNDKDLAERGRRIEQKMDMMISDFSMVPARLSLRYRGITQEVNGARVDRDAAMNELNRLGEFATRVNNMPEGPQKYGASIVCAAELELLRKRVNPLLQVQ